MNPRFPSVNPGVESFFLDLPQVGGVSYMTKAIAVGMKFVFRVNGQSSLGNQVVSEQYVVNIPGLVGVALFYSWFYSKN